MNPFSYGYFYKDYKNNFSANGKTYHSIIVIQNDKWNRLTCVKNII